MIETMNVLKENMEKAAQRGFINATDCADYLVKKGMPFRDAYKTTGQIVAICTEQNKTLDNLELEEYKNYLLNKKYISAQVLNMNNIQEELQK